LAAAIWVGGHVYLLFIFPRSLRESDSLGERVLAAFRAYSRVIVPVFIILILSGFSNSLLSAPAAPNEISAVAFGDTYRTVLFSKILLALLAAAVGVIASFRLLPRLTRAIESGESQAAQAKAVAKSLKTTSAVNLTIGSVALLLATTLANLHQLILVGLS